jgi:hypothetical protein
LKTTEERRNAKCSVPVYSGRDVTLNVNCFGVGQIDNPTTLSKMMPASSLWFTSLLHRMTQRWKLGRRCIIHYRGILDTYSQTPTVLVDSFYTVPRR